MLNGQCRTHLGLLRDATSDASGVFVASGENKPQHVKQALCVSVCVRVCACVCVCVRVCDAPRVDGSPFTPKTLGHWTYGFEDLPPVCVCVCACVWS